MVINEIRRNEDSRRVLKAVQQPHQGQWTNWENTLQRSVTWNDMWHMAPLRISFLIRSVYDLLPSNANLVRWGKKEDPTCPLCNGRETTEHVLSSCKAALSQRRYTWRHNRPLQELAVAINMAKGQSTQPQADAVIFTTEGGVKSWHGTAVKSTNQKKCQLDGCDDWEVSADLPECDSHPSIIKETKTKAWYRDPFILHTANHYGGVNSSIRKHNGRDPHLQKGKIPEPDQRAKRCQL